MGGAVVAVGWKPFSKHSLLSQTQQIQVCERERGRKDECVRKGEGRGWERSRRGKEWRREASVYSQCCDMFVMFSHHGDSQTVCFHFSVWHLTPTVTPQPSVVQLINESSQQPAPSHWMPYARHANFKAISPTRFRHWKLFVCCLMPSMFNGLWKCKKHYFRVDRFWYPSHVTSSHSSVELRRLGLA